MSRLHWFNNLSFLEARAELLRCCGSTRWAERLAHLRPFAHEATLYAEAERVWAQTGPEDWREAMTHHPRIGDVSKLREKFKATATWSSQEQRGVQGASEEVLHGLAEGNREYEARFGFIFLVCATGKSAGEMLALLRERMANPPDVELRVAAGEQAKITRIRLEKLLNLPMSTLSTHVLDTQWGRPAAGVPITLELQAGDGWRELARGTTNADGRMRDFLPAGTRLEAGTYRMTFHTAEYFRAHSVRGFYPYVSVVFELTAVDEHYHVPLLLSPFGYSTYRGS